MGMIADLFVKLGLNSTGFNQGLNQAQAQTNTFSNGIKKIGGLIAGAFAVSSIFNFAKTAVTEYDKAEQAATRLLTALKGNVQVQQSLIRLAEERQKVTLYEDDEIVAAMAKLTMYTREEAKIKQLIPLIQDFATAQQMDLVTAAGAVGKAVSGSNMMLQKMGFITTGTAGSAERFASVMTVLNDKTGGQAMAAAQTGIGALKLLGLQWQDMKEKIGGAIVNMDSWKSTMKELNDIIYVFGNNNISVWKTIKLALFATEKEAMAFLKGQRALEQGQQEYADREAEMQKQGKKSVSVIQQQYTAAEIYQGTLAELKDALNEAEQALKFKKPDESFITLGAAVDDARKKLEEFRKAHEKVIREVGLKKITSGPRGGESVKSDIVPGLMTSPNEDRNAKIEFLENYLQSIEDFNAEFKQTIESGMMDAAMTFSEGIAGLMSGDLNIGGFGANLLKVVGNFMQQFGAAMIAMGIATIQLKLGMKSLNGGLLIAGGAALVVAGSAISSLASSGPGGGGGGASVAASYGYSGGGNTGGNDMNKVIFELHGNVLKGVLNNQDRRNSNFK